MDREGGFDTRTILITGASRGIGRACALAFAREYRARCNLVLNCLKNADMLHETAEQARALGSNVLEIVRDVSDYGGVREMSARAAALGGPDILVNNAGIAHIGLFGDMTPGQIGRVIGVNLMSAINCCHVFAPAMIRRRYGRIINISSVWGVSGASCEAVYSAAKGGVNAFTRALAKELAPSGVNVNAIACGVIDTDMNPFHGGDERERMIDRIPACRFGTAGEVAGAALFLASDAAAYINGQVIVMDGGLL